jgi:hypothetical protein
MIEKNQVQKTNFKAIGLIALTAFVVVFVITSLVLNYAWGYDFKNSSAYNETMNITKNAANYTDGLMIKLYIQNIENQTLGEIQ